MTDAAMLHATIGDLRRRIAAIEAVVLGRVQDDQRVHGLTSLYIDACKAPTLDAVTTRHWVRQVQALDVRQLLVLARFTRDPHPWKPFLALLDVLIEAGFDAAPARDWVLSLAQELLDIQGLGKISPRDVMGSPLRIRAAVEAIRR
jgi:hypothetical protein